MAALRRRLAQDQARSLLVQIIGIAAIIGGAVAGGGGSNSLGNAGQGVLMGGNELLMRGLTAERREQESAADQAGLKYLAATEQSGLGMLTTFERFAGQSCSRTLRRTRSSCGPIPLATNRLARLRQLVEQSPFYSKTDPPELQFRHDMMRAKLSGYIEPPGTVFNRYPMSNMSVPARYARAIARFRQGGSGGLEVALAEIDTLIAEQPSNPYFWEVKGDFLQKSGRAQAAVPVYRKALQLLGGNAPLVAIALGQVLVQSKAPGAADEAIALLRKAVTQEPDNATATTRSAKPTMTRACCPNRSWPAHKDCSISEP